MQLKYLFIGALAAPACAQTLGQALAGQSSLSNLTTYLSLYPTFLNTLQSMSNITVLAPNNAAFSKFSNSSIGQTDNSDIVQAFFTYHVLNGSHTNFSTTPTFLHTALMPPVYTNVTGGQVVEVVGGTNTSTFYSGLLQNSSSVGEAITYSGGVVHIVDAVMTIPENITESAIQLGLSSAVGALEATNLTSAVDSMSDVTVFVPDNSAFQAIAGTLATLPIANLSNILEYHVVNGTVGYSSMLKNSTLNTFNGGSIKITVANGSVFVNAAEVITPNILVSNGVLHVINNVLNPADSHAAANSSQTAGAAGAAFSGASSGSAAPFTSGVPTPTSVIDTMITPGATSTSSAAAGSGSSSSQTAGVRPMKTGAMGAAALFGGAAFMMNV